jgi:tetratricopeptide (TPR) repeat protein
MIRLRAFGASARQAPCRAPGAVARQSLGAGIAAVAALLVAGAATPRAAQSPLRGADALVRVYDFILEARFDQAASELQRACGPAPTEACAVMRATSLWWQILLNPEDRSLDDEISAAAERAIGATQAWTERAPRDAEAWFYLGAAYAVRVQWRVLRDERLAAARDGKRIRESLEQAIELEPSLDDAYFGLGMYKYYADVAPAAARFLRMLLLLPGGDREEGLREMLRARNKGRLLQGEADYQLHIIYLWYERRTDRALQLLRSLQEQYPGNPLFLSQIAEIQDSYEHDVTASLASWRSLLAASREQRVNAGGLAGAQARLGIAKHLETLHQTDHAIEQLADVIALRPPAPYSVLALAHLRLGEAHDRIGARDLAVASYRAAIAAVPARDPYDVREQAAEKLRRPPDARRAEAYRLSLEGWRRLERNDAAGAAAALERSLTLNPGDPVARYRHGRALQALQDDAEALDAFELAIRDAPACPAPVLGAAYLEAARLHERGGRRDRALSYYRITATLFGAAADTRAAASRALTRLTRK